MKTNLNRRAAALVVVLSTLVLVIILVIALTVAMRMDRSASFFYFERARAEAIARQGVDCSIALLLDATQTNRFWISGPGYIVASPTNNMGPPNVVFRLSSGNTNATNIEVSSDLNRLAIDPTDRLLDPSGTNFYFQWIYIQKDGTYTNSKTANSVGRFAFWTDDDSSRVDVNTADTRSTPLTADPSQISIGALSGLAPFAGSISAEARSQSFLTPFDVMGRNSAWTNALFTNRFFLSYHTQDPDVDPWGQPRVVLTTRGDISGGRRHLDILAHSPNDPGKISNLSPGRLQTAFVSLFSQFTRTNWPFAQGTSFENKFGTSGATQLAVDVIEYVRTAESTNIWIEPIVATTTPSSINLLPAGSTLSDLAGGEIIGTVRRPMLCQVGVFCSTNSNPAGNAFIGTLHVQTWLPPSYNAGSVTFNDWTLWGEISSTSGSYTNTITVPLGPVSYTDGYATNAINDVEIPANIAAGIPSDTRVRVAFLKSANPLLTSILDVAPLQRGSSISCSTTTNTTAYSAVNDPRVNKFASDWSSRTNLTGNVPPPSHERNYSAYVAIPPSDGSSDGVFMNPPGSRISSIAEIGYIASGVNSSSRAPWRSIRLRANSSASTNVPPDWALLELFSAPVAQRFLKGSNTIAGRINLNALIRDTTNFTRTNVLNALFTNVSGISPGSFATVVSNVANVRLASAGMNFGYATNFTNFVSVGQLSEIAGIGDQGEIGEQVLRQVASLATVRGDVFSIYSCGQAISVANGRVTVNGEKFIHATIERYFDASGAAKYRTISWSEINP